LKRHCVLLCSEGERHNERVNYGLVQLL
jgi:hypothetical protein